MPKLRPLSCHELSYLDLAVHTQVPYAEMAKTLSVCTDTLKRILMREGLAYFDGAKFVVSQTLTLKTTLWTRPCTTCGCTRPRPKYQFRCNRCHELEDDAGLDDHHLWS